MKPQEELEYLKDFIQLTEHQAQKRNDLERFLYRNNKTLLIDADSLLFNVAHFHLDDASEIPFSVIKPVTYFAGVTSKARFIALLFLG